MTFFQVNCNLENLDKQRRQGDYHSCVNKRISGNVFTLFSVALNSYWKVTRQICIEICAVHFHLLNEKTYKLAKRLPKSPFLISQVFHF